MSPSDEKIEDVVAAITALAIAVANRAANLHERDFHDTTGKRLGLVVEVEMVRDTLRACLVKP